jgi:hypothetical protein
MALFSPKTDYGKFVVKQLVKSKDGYWVSTPPRKTSYCPITALGNAIFGGLLNLLVWSVTKMVARTEARVKQWQQKRELQRIIKYNELYRLERLKERERQRPPTVN